MGLLLMLIGIIGLLFSIFSYNEYKHIPESRQKSIIILGVSIIVFVLGIIVYK